jgi:hypothetical protein
MTAKTTRDTLIAEASDIVLHLAGGGMDYFNMIDLFAHPHANVVPDDTFLLIAAPAHTTADAPKALAPTIARAGPLPPKTALVLAAAAFKQCDRAVGIAYVQGRGIAGSDVHRMLSALLREISEVPYPLAVALRALRPDIQQFVAAATHRLVTMAPTFDAIDALLEECCTTPLRFTMHSPAWAACAAAFADLGCAGVVVRPGCAASIVLDGTGIAMTRRDTILLVLVLLFRRGAPPPEGTLAAIVATRKWFGTVAQLPWWT